MTPKSHDITPLDAVGWLAEQPADFIDWVAGVGRWRKLAADELVYEAGDEPDGLYGLADGSLDLTFPLIAEEPVTLHRAQIGFWIGESALLAGETRAVSIRAAAPSRVLFVPATAARTLLAERPEHWRAFYVLSHINTLSALGLLAEALSLSVRARAARRLLALADADGVVHATQEEIAKHVGVARGTMQRALADLGREGLLERGHGRLKVVNKVALERLMHES